MDNKKSPILRAPVEFEGYRSLVDDTCEIVCECGNNLFFGEAGRLCECGRFYFTNFQVFVMDYISGFEDETHKDFHQGWSVSDVRVAHLT